MNAGSALGLLAGLGAINALRGGKDGKRFTSLIDMIDGGGAGQSGDKFEGGGLLSMLGNLFAKPYDAQDNVERIAKEAAAAKTVAPMLRPKDRPSEEDRLMGMPVQAMSSEDRLMGMPVQAMSAEDRLMGMPVQANPLYAQAAAEAGMGLDPFGGDGVASPAPASDPYAYLFQRQGQQSQSTPAPQVGAAPSGLLPEQAASGVAPSVSMSTDPMMRGTRNPSAYAPMQPMPEAQPAIDQSSGPMTFEQYVPYITKRYKMEYGINANPTANQLQQAYAIYRQGMGM